MSGRWYSAEGAITPVGLDAAAAGEEEYIALLTKVAPTIADEYTSGGRREKIAATRRMCVCVCVCCVYILHVYLTCLYFSSAFIILIFPIVCVLKLFQA